MSLGALPIVQEVVNADAGRAVLGYVQVAREPALVHALPGASRGAITDVVTHVPGHAAEVVLVVSMPNFEWSYGE